METKRWLKALCNYDIIEVCQRGRGDSIFLDREGKSYHISALDFTHVDDNDFLSTFTKDVEESNKRFEEQQERMDKLLSSMDAKAIADHKAKIDEREYWRKLRGDIALAMVKEHGKYDSPSSISDMADYVTSELYRQDKEMFDGQENE